MKIDKSSFFLVGLGLFLIVFSLYASSTDVVRTLHESLRQGKEVNRDIELWLSDLQQKGVFFGAVLCAVALVRLFFGDAIRGFLNPDRSHDLPQSVLDLFLISALSLFAELLIIRWLAVEMRIFAYFKNVPLISCYLGLGLGAASAETKGRVNYFSFPFWFSLFAVIVVFLGPRLIFVNPAGADEYIWGIGRANSSATQAIAATFFIATVLFIFIWNTKIFMALGYMTGRLLTGFKPLTAYSINIVGSLTGILVFGAFCYFSSPPVVWFGVVLVSFLIFLRNSRRYLVAMLVVSVVFLGYLHTLREPNKIFWSPYYKIKLIPSFINSRSTGQEMFQGYSLHVNEDSHQTGMDYSREFIANHADPDRKATWDILELPFKVREPKRALIVGSGMGNDVAAALRAGVDEVHAVEIDPMILKIGREYHPEKPYNSPRVRAINDDARAYFKKTKEKYDVVVFGILDSHTQFSSLSSLRLDNYVYTLQSFKDAKALLKPGGVLSITFGGDAKTYWMGKRFYEMLKEVFGKEPIALDLGRAMFLAGEDLTRDELAADPDWKGYFPSGEISYSQSAPVPLATDDWPFIYMRGRQVPKLYFVMIAGLCLVAWLFVKRYLKGQSELDLHFFFLGSAFLLLETKAVSELALVFGTTWTVNAIVFSGIMILILLGNALVSALKIKEATVAYALLAASLLFSYFFDLAHLTHFSFFAKVFLSTFVVLLPVFFASIIFAVSFSKARSIPSAFGSNLLGAVIGGFLEYASLVTGIRFLALMALVIYLISLAALKRNWKLSF